MNTQKSFIMIGVKYPRTIITEELVARAKSAVLDLISSEEDGWIDTESFLIGDSFDIDGDAVTYDVSDIQSRWNRVRDIVGLGIGGKNVVVTGTRMG